MGSPTFTPGGVQNPGKYGVATGPNYAKYGEQPGYVYIPQSDTYATQAGYDQKQKLEEIKNKQIEDALHPPKPKGVTDLALPIAGTALAYYGGKAAAESIPGLFGKTAATQITGDTGGLLTGGGGTTAGGVGSAEGVGAATSQGAGVAPGVAGTGSEAVGAGGAQAAGAESLGGFGGATPLAAYPVAAYGAYLTGKSAYNQLQGKQDDNSIQGKVGRGLLAFTSFGGSEVARKLGIGGTDTRDLAKKHTKDLLKQAGDDKNAQGYVQGMREQFNKPPPDPSKPFFGKYSSFDEYKKAGLNATDLSGVYGNLNTFGAKEWSNLTQAQREAVTQGLINAGLYESKHGEVVVTDGEKAKAIYTSVLNNKTQPLPANQPAQAAPAQQPAAQPAQVAPAQPAPAQTVNVPQTIQPNLRSSTHSPGIGLNGQRLTGRALLGLGSR